MERQLRQTWVKGEDAAQASAELPDYGWVRFRKTDVSEPHAWQPPTVKALQSVVGSARNVPQPTDPAGAFAIYTKDVIWAGSCDVARSAGDSPAGAEIGVDDVESPVRALCKRFVASAMSLGSLSPEAHQTITAAMNMLGGRSNTGEGGEDSRRVSCAARVGLRDRVQWRRDGASLLARSAGGTAIASLRLRRLRCMFR